MSPALAFTPREPLASVQPSVTTPPRASRGSSQSPAVASSTHAPRCLLSDNCRGASPSTSRLVLCVFELFLPSPRLPRLLLPLPGAASCISLIPQTFCSCKPHSTVLPWQLRPLAKVGIQRPQTCLSRPYVPHLLLGPIASSLAATDHGIGPNSPLPQTRSLPASSKHPSSSMHQHHRLSPILCPCQPMLHTNVLPSI